MYPWIFGLAAVVGLWVLFCFVLARAARWGSEADERHEVQTTDGWTLLLRRYRPVEGASSRAAPIILGHGLNMNRHCWALSGRGDLPRALAARGHDVFVAEYRGTDSSRAPEADALGAGAA